MWGRMDTRFPHPISDDGAAPAERAVRCWHLADIFVCIAHVRFWGQSGHDLLRCTCLLLTQSGHV